jgi:uncharacterized protein YfaS (alpha-2-macroglobulin family)
MKIQRFLIATLLALVYLFPSCKSNKTTVDVPDIRAQEYIVGYTSGTVKRDQEIIVKFTRPVIDADKVGSQADAKVFSLSPAVKGVLEWDDVNTLVFTPENNYEWGKEYTAKLNLAEVFGRDVSLKEFEFSILTPSKNFSVDLTGLSLDDEGEMKYYLEGFISTSGEFEYSEAEAIIKAEQEGKSLEIEWEHQDDGTGHVFYIRNIERNQARSVVTVSWDGKAAGVNLKGSEKIEVPAMNEFKLTSWRVVSSPSQYLMIEFSDLINKDIELNGMVMIDGQSTERISRTGNALNVFTASKLTGNHSITVDGALTNAFDFNLGEDIQFTVDFGGVKPGVRLRGDGVILPQSDGLIFPFEAANLKAVDLRITKIFSNNIHYFLQDNNLDGSYQLSYFGRQIMAAKVDLQSESKMIDYGSWNAFSLDLANYIEVEKGAIYRVEIGFRKSYSLFPCDNDEEADKYYYPVEEEGSYPRSEYSSVYYDRYYDWQNRDNPCNQAYYSPDKFVTRNILGSNFGIIAKRDKAGKVNVVVTDLSTARPLPDVMVDAFDLQNQQLASVRTDNDGFADFSSDRNPFLLVVSKNGEFGYLKMTDGSALSMSNFDVSGQSSISGTKGFIYGERGVWRPGDSVYVSFILEDKMESLPKGHPILFELYDTRGQLVKRMSRTKSDRVIYPFWFATGDDDPTGNWNAKVKVGGAEFNKRIRIETVKPNRLKINLDFGDDILLGGTNHLAKLESRWLHGTPASGLKARINATFRELGTSFEGYDGFVFDAPFGSPYFPEKKVFEADLDNEGKADVSFTFRANDDVNEMLMATFITRVFESGGDFSINRITKKISPFNRYVGFEIPWSDERYKRLNTDEEHIFNVVSLDQKGKKVSASDIGVKVYKLDWRYWWSRSGENLASYNGRTYHKPVYTTKIKAINGEGTFKLQVQKGAWGRYLIMVDLPGANVAAKVVYFDWPWGRKQSAGGADILNVSTEKDSYNVGEKVIVSFPAGISSNALLTLENGSEVLRQQWIKDIEENTTWSFEATSDMAPNIYVHVSLINPHAETANDLPIRMYGIAPVSIENPESHLNPLIEMPDKLRPEQEFTVKISEKEGKAMEYTLAIVDEGLLDLTNFRTPDPWPAFFSKEALGVKTWDMYRYVLGAYGGELEKMFAIGGDEAGVDNSKNEGKRFEPVVEVLGPFVLAAGKSRTHTLSLPQYIGSVRVMAVAASKKAYGNAEKAVPVNNPVMVLGTLPRVLAPGEKISVPVAVFVMEENIKKVNVEIEGSDLLLPLGETAKILEVDGPGEYEMEFSYTVAATTGKAKIDITASSGKESGKHEIFIDIRNPNPPETKGEIKKIEPGASYGVSMDAFGTFGSNHGKIEVGGILPLNLEKRLGYLMRYPHGCIEQTVSAVFPQLYLKDLSEVGEAKLSEVNSNIMTALDQMRQFQLGSGAMAFWPGGSYESTWGSIYAAHFIVEAEKAGFGIPGSVKSRLIDWLKSSSNRYRFNSSQPYEQVSQAYALYVLSLAGEPASGAMNRLRERSDDLEFLARWYLASAYILSGRQEVGTELSDLRDLSPKRSYYQIYGSADRTKAVILNTLTLLGKDEEAFRVAKEISDALASGRWMNTQATAWSLVALSEFFGEQNITEPIEYSLSVNGSKKKHSSRNIVDEYEINNDRKGGAEVSLENTGNKALYVSFAWTGTPIDYSTVSESRGIELRIEYKDKSGRITDPSSLIQGTDFTAEVYISNQSAIDVYDLALTQIFPSGWEIMNTRLFEGAAVEDNSPYDYRDIRDDRVYTYFNLPRGKSYRYVVNLSASYEGEYILPATVCEGMYDNDFFAKTAGRRVKVIKQ